MSTPYMNLTLPTVSVTLGPQWASELNTAIELVDSHDHTTDKGQQITPPAININSSLDFNSQKAINLYSAQFIDQLATLTGASNARSVYVVSGDLYFTNGAGAAVQITSGGSLPAVPGSVTSFSSTSITSDLTIIPADTFVHIKVVTTAPRIVTLPLASSVVAGRIFYIKDFTGSSPTNNITVQTSGGDTIDGSSTYLINSEYHSLMVVSDGISVWMSS